MIIHFSPNYRDGTLTLERAGDTLIINGDPVDLSGVVEGEPLDWDEAYDLHPMLAGPVARTDGVLSLTLTLPHGPNPSPAVAFPEPVTVTQDGPIEVPREPEPE